MNNMTPEQALHLLTSRLQQLDFESGLIDLSEDLPRLLEPDEKTARGILLAALSANGGDVVTWQFYQDGKWWNGDDRIKDHRANTEAAGIPIRELFTAPQPVAQNVEWFFYDAENGNIELCETKEEALSKAQKAVDFCFDECWSDEVEQICVGTITHRAKQTDLMFKPQKLDEDMFSEDGEHWPEDCESKCNYSIEPIDPQPQGGGE